MKKIVLYSLLLMGVISFAQEKEKRNQEKMQNKGKAYFYWGWNRSFYSNSDITFEGDDYNFTLDNVIADDRQDEVNTDYVNPGRITIPQTNMRIGYFFHDNWNISFGIDHMKYVMRPYQEVTINGEINNGTQYDGIYNNDKITLDPDFLSFEHTDGLNYVNIEVNRFDRLNDLFNFYIKHVDISLTEGLGVGMLYPKTNTRLMDNERYDEFHLSGYGVSAKAGLNITFFKYVFIQSECKVGYINMPDIRTTQSSSDSASQDFTFLQGNIVFGGRFPICNPKKKEKVPTE